MAARSRDPQLVDKTARLIEFLKELASAKREPIRDIAAYEAIHWLNELPADVKVHTSAEPNEVLFSIEAPPQLPVPVIPDRLDGWIDKDRVSQATIEAPPLRKEGPVTYTEIADGERRAATERLSIDKAPGILAAYEAWVPVWRRWAEQERALADHRRWHQRLWGHADTLSQHDDEFELVLTAGLLTWKSPEGTKVRNHILVTPVEIARDNESQRIEIRLGSRTTFQDRHILDDLAGFDPRRTDHVRNIVREGEDGFGLHESVSDQLQNWCGRAFEYGAAYSDMWEPPAQDDFATQVRLAPALVFRKRDRASLISYYEQMLGALSGPDAEAPLGLAQLVTSLEPDERMSFMGEQVAGTGLGADPLFPLPSNPEQSQIIHRLQADNGVVVQGPPGTGKTHTIANLISSLLAEGQRVLVTSQKGQALRVLRDKLPTGISHLCVSATDQARGGSAELEGSVKMLSSRHSSYDAQAQAKKVEKSQERLAEARRAIAILTERIRAIREAETFDHGTIAPGYGGTLAQIVSKIKEREGTLNWMPKGCVAAPPIPAGEAWELLTLLAAATPQRAARVDQRLPDPADLPSAERLRALIAAEAATHQAANVAGNELSERLESCDEKLFALLEKERDTAETAFHELDSRSDAWVDRAIQAGLLGREAALWDQLELYGDRATVIAQACATLGVRAVTLPTYESVGSLLGLRDATVALRDFLAGGGKLKRGLFAHAIQRQAEPILQSALVDGVPPQTVELLDLVLAEIAVHIAHAELSRCWGMVHVTFPEAPLPLMSACVTETYEQLSQVRRAIAAINTTTGTLAAVGIRISLRAREEWTAYVGSLRAVRLRLDAERATRELAELGAGLEIEIAKGHAPPELVSASRAVAVRDVGCYDECLTALAEAVRELCDHKRCAVLLSAVRDVHPALAQLMSTSPSDPAWQQRLGVWDDAWAWGNAVAFFDQQRRPGLEQQLEAELEAETRRHLKLTAELASEKAWHQCLGRMTGAHSQALKAYRDFMSKLGKGTGRYAPRYRLRAREAMTQSLHAIPAWIMPLPQVVETIPPLRDSFDVVIVDEASQASLDALFLLWLAPRVIVVGDDKQCAPSMINRGELQPIFTKLAAYLPDVPAYLRDVFTPNSSLFDILSTRFGSTIRLKEHFRCMPEIIQYSSRQFYGDEPLVPLRRFGVDRLPPLRTVHVTGAFTEGSATKLRNQTEAKAIVEQVKACIADPAYEGKTFGVVVIQGTGQVQLLQNLLHAEIELKELDRRKVRVGTPPDFQGDERDVIFLSMVIAEERVAVTSTEWQRRFNVAASRAKDQMWLFHSVPPDLLRSNDLRRSLLTYMLTPPTILSASSMLTDVTETERHPDFDSLFEQRVFLEIRRRGYHVVPQFEVNGRRIDLVISGARGRLAVECDGDYWHGTPEQIREDNERERELKRAGWRFWRVRESEFYFSREDALASLWSTLEHMGIQPGDGDLSSQVAGAQPASWTATELAGIDGWDGLEDGDIADLEQPGPVAEHLRPRAAARPSDPVRTLVPAHSKPRVAAPKMAGRESVKNGKPHLPQRLPILSYGQEQLVALIHWHERDGQQRTITELTELVVEELDINQTRTVTEAIHRAITESRRNKGTRLKDREATEWQAGTAEVREWAKRNRYEMDSDRIPSHVCIAYNRAHPERPY
ncbi:very short patch repair endonuclease [Acrocarpospora pleiomorpha]|uniref:Very short patch repair endonuclease n=1 Tax=Acrocarpospora pleiomorpha TaxID=90975 RepID=A0A5M3XZQ1_9ACTN|nr:AAA domain-containing protein [Acrocarpospora pleiomorpha]GES26542.1 very short patch repair endonuclease [Acrocarpospora pleiomorpha]